MSNDDAQIIAVSLAQILACIQNTEQRLEQRIDDLAAGQRELALHVLASVMRAINERGDRLRDQQANALKAVTDTLNRVEVTVNETSEASEGTLEELETLVGRSVKTVEDVYVVTEEHQDRIELLFDRLDDHQDRLDVHQDCIEVTNDNVVVLEGVAQGPGDLALGNARAEGYAEGYQVAALALERELRERILALESSIERALKSDELRERVLALENSTEGAAAQFTALVLIAYIVFVCLRFFCVVIGDYMFA